MNSLIPRWCCYVYCCLTHSFCVELTQRWGLAHVEKDSESASSVHAISFKLRVSCRARDVLPVCSTSIWTMCDVPAGLLHWATAWLAVPVLCMCLYFCVIFCVIFCGLQSQSHSDGGRVYATALCSVYVLRLHNVLRLSGFCGDEGGYFNNRSRV